MLANLVTANHGLAQWFFLIAVFISAVVVIAGFIIAVEHRPTGTWRGVGLLVLGVLAFLLFFALLLGG